MAGEEIVAAEANLVPSDHKRKFEDLEPEALTQGNEPSSEQPAESNASSKSETDAAQNAEIADSDESDAKRARVDENPNALAKENGFQEENGNESIKDEQPTAKSPVPDDEGQPPPEAVSDRKTNQQPSKEASELLDDQKPTENSVADNVEEPQKESEEHPAEFSQQDNSSGMHQHSSNEVLMHKIEVPNNKVGVLIGKAGDTIRYLQINSGAKIQIMRDADADPQSSTRPVELIGNADSIEKAEKLIKAVIAEADAGGSPALVARGLSSVQAAAGSEQIQIQVPYEKVGLIIGRGGETIKGLQTRSGARIQLIPQHSDGDNLKERTVQVTGDKRQIEIAREMIREVMSQPVRPSISSGYNQQGYRPRGSSGPPQWGQRGAHFGQPTGYDYQHRGPYPSRNQQYPPPYGNYSQQMAPRSSFGGGWEQRPPPHGGSYDYYGSQGGHLSDGSASGHHSSSVPPHGPGPSPVPPMAPSPNQANYSYGQPHGADYGQQAPYSQAAHPHQGYGHGYDEMKYDSRAPTQHSYGGLGNMQPSYPQVGSQHGYAAQQQYGKPPPYGAPSQGQPPQSYGPRATQPGDMPYQGSAPAQPYGQNQPYPYGTGGPALQYPPYGSAPAADGYSQPPPASGPIYHQQGGQPAYSQPGAQLAPSYGQGTPAGSYATYMSAQGYSEQPASNNTNYGYQGPQDPNYPGGTASGYSAPPSGQPAYTQPAAAAAQPGYDQTAAQSGSYGTAPAASAGYGKTLSPQPSYPQYDSTQMYGGAR